MTINVTTTKNTVTVNGDTQVVTVNSQGPQGTFSDGNLGDVTVSNSGTSILINSGAIDNANIASNAAIDLTKLATGALPTAITVTSANISDLSIVNADINASAAIAGTKISPDFGSQNIVTTGTGSTGALSVTGNITVSGNVDGRDVAADGTKLDGIETGATADQTASEIVALIADQTIAPSTIDMEDNEEIRIGTSDDLIIVHDGHSRIKDTGTGALLLETDGGSIQLNKGTSENMIVATVDGKVELFHNGTGKIETQASGIGVSGNISVSGTVDGRDVAADGIKLDGIESNATADQTASEILTLLKTVDGAGSGLNADTLDGISSASFVRSDAADTCSGKITFSDGIVLPTTGDGIKFGAGDAINDDAHIEWLGGGNAGYLRISISDDSGSASPEYIEFGDYSSIDKGGTFTRWYKLSRSGHEFTGDISVSGTVDGVDIATRDTLFGGLTSSSGVLTNGVTATTQSAGDNSTKVATTAYTDTAISNLVDSSPSTLNTLNELAAALGDDANFSTTVTNSIATKLPLAGGTLTGNLTISNTEPKLFLTDTNNNDDYSIQNQNGYFAVKDESDGQNRLVIHPDGTAVIGGNLDVGAGIDVTGNVIASGNITANNGTVTVSGSAPKITFTETNDNPDYKLEANGGNLAIIDTTNSATRFSVSLSGVSVTGNITVTGTVDGRDIATDGTKLDGIESNATADQTASEIVALVADQTIAPSEIDMEDNEKIKIGTGDDLQIYHDGDNSYIIDIGTGSLILGGDRIRLRSSTGEDGIEMFQNGAVELYYDNSKKFNTTATGATITGTCNMTSLNCTSSGSTGANFTVGGDATVSGGQLTLGAADSASGHLNAFEVMTFNIDSDNDDTNRYFAFYKNGNSGSGTEIFRIQEDGKVGINETSPETLLHISNGDANDGPIILIEGSGQNAANNLLGGINFRNLDSSGDGPTITGAIRHRTANSSGNGGYLTFHTHDGSEGGEGSDAVERLRITSDGNVQIPADNAMLQFGAGQDLQLSHDGSSSLIRNNTGELVISTGGSGNSNPVRIQPNQGEESIVAHFNERVELYFDNSKKLETTSTGVSFNDGNISNVGTIAVDSIKGDADDNTNITFAGNDVITFKCGSTSPALTVNTTQVKVEDNQKFVVGTGNDLQIYHDGSNSYIDETGTGGLYIRVAGTPNNGFYKYASNEQLATFQPDNAVRLFYDNSKKFETTSSGVKFTGTLEAIDNQSILLGTSNDLRIRHTGSHSEITDEGTGDLRLGASRTVISNTAFDETQARFIQNGAVELYHDNVKQVQTTADGFGFVNNCTFSDNKKIQMGNGNDLQIFFDGTHSKIDHTPATGSLFLGGDGLVLANSGFSEYYLIATENGAVQLNYDDSQKLATFSGGISVTGQVNSDGSHMGDNDKALFGDSNDLEIYHDGNHSRIKDTGTGDLVLHSNAISFMNAADSEQIARFHQDGSNELYYDNSKKLETKSTGIELHNGGLDLNRSTALHSGAIYFDSPTDTNHVLWNDYFGNPNTTRTTTDNFDGMKWNCYGGLQLFRGNEAETIAKFLGNGANELYYDNSKKFETHSGGVSVFGNLSLTSADSHELRLGAGSDLKLFHDGTHSRVHNNTGALLLETDNNSIQLNKNTSENMVKANIDGSVELYYDNSKKLETTSSGGLVTGQLLASSGFKVNDGVHITLGTDNDFKLYHDGSNAAWLNTTGNNYLYGSGGNFFIRPVNGEGSIDAIANGAVNLYYDNSKKFETTSTGIKTTGNVAANETIVQVLHANETQGVGTGFNGLHMIGSNTNVEMSLRSKGTGVVKLQSSANEDMAIFTPNGAVELYYDNDKKLETTSDGVDVTGELDVAGDFKTSTARGYTLDIQDGVNGSRTSVTLTFVTGSNARTAFVEMFVGTANYHLHHVSHRHHNYGLNVLTNDGTGCTVSSSVSGAGNSNITYTYTVTFDAATNHPYARFRVSLGAYILAPITSASISFGT